MNAPTRPSAHARLLLLASAALLPVFLHPPSLRAISVHGLVTDQLNQPISGAVVALVDNGKVLLTVRTALDGSYSLSTATAGRFYVLAGGNHFRELSTESFYGDALASVERNVTLEPDTVHESIVVSATGTPLPEAQVSASVTELNWTDFANLQNVTDALRTVPGFSLSTSGERGAVTSLFIRGGNSDNNKVVLDGIPVNDVGGIFDFSKLSTTGISNAEGYRGPDSVVYGTDAAAGVVTWATPRGTTPFPSLFYEGDGGNFGTYRNEIQGGGTRNKLDYFGAFGDFQTSNTILHNQYHDVTSALNLGYALSTATGLRVTARNTDSANGAPGQFQFTRTPTDQKQSDQNLNLSANLDHTFSDRWLGELTYGLTRNHDQFRQFNPTGVLDPASGNYLGQFVSVTGANGYTVSGQTITSYGGADSYQDNYNSNRDVLHAQTSYSFNPHLLGVLGFWYTDERGLASYYIGEPQRISRNNYDYTLAFQGDYNNRLFYSFGGGVEKNSLFGTVGAPHIGLAYYVTRPGQGLIQGTRLSFNFSKGYKEPTLGQQTGSLLNMLDANGGSFLANSFATPTIGPALTRSYDGGIEQSFASERALVKLTYFHNEFGNQIESISSGAVAALFPTLSAWQQDALRWMVDHYGADLNSLSFRAQGFESEVQYSPKRNLFLRGGYTYLNARVQHSFTSDVVDPANNINPAFPGVAIGNTSPLIGARPFRRPPHTGFLTATYTAKKWSGIVIANFAGRADDSTYLGGSDSNYGNSLLLPNRNLDSGYTSLNAGINYQLNSHVGAYTQLDNLLSQQHASPVGYLSTPMTARAGIRFTLGHTQK